jgi:tetratricopeptide (TPR) repeat protein
MSGSVDTLPSFVVFLAMAIDKNTVLKDAQKFVAKGQFDKAIAEWKKLLRETPSDPNIYNTIGDLCLKKNAKTDAVDAYKKAADLLATDGFTSKAIALYKKVLNIDSKRMDVHLALGDLNAEKGITGAALESYKVVADHYTREKDTVKTLGIYQKMADLNPANVSFRVKLGDMYAKEKMIAEASKAYLDAADMHVTKNAFQDARKLFEKVLSLDPGNTAVYHKAGVVYYKEGKFAEASKALKRSFENDPSNQELAELYLDALSKGGNQDEAEDALLKLLEVDTGRADLREKLYHLYRSNNDHEKALTQVAVLAQAKQERDEVEAAEDLLKSFVSETPQFAPGRRKLAAFYASINRKDEAVAELLQASELLTTAEDREGAKALLTQALEIVPGDPKAASLLEQLETSASARAPAAEEFVAPEPPRDEEPLETRAFAPNIFEMPPPQPEQPTVGEEDPAINDAFTEVDVLIKYGLASKALEQLEGLAERYAANVRVRIRLRDLYREQGNLDKVVQHTLALSDIYSQQGNNDLAKAALQTALEMARDNPAILSNIGKPPVTAEAAPPEEQLPEFMPDQLDIAPPVSEPSPVAFDETPSSEPFSPTDDTITFEGLDTQLPPLDEVASFETPPAPENEPQSFEAPPAPEAPENEPQPVEEAPQVLEKFLAPKSREEREPEVDLVEVWAEAEFYYQQGLFDEAKKHYAKIIGSTPSDRRAIDRLAEISREEDETREFSKLTDAVEGLENIVSAGSGEGELATSASDEEAVSRLMKEIAELHKEQQSAPIPPPTPRRTPPPAVDEEPTSRSMKEIAELHQEQEASPLPPPPPPEKPRPVDEKPASRLLQKIAELRKEQEASPLPPLPRKAPQPEKPKPLEPAEGAGKSAAPLKKRGEEDFYDLGVALEKEASPASPPAQKKKSEDFFDLAAELRDELSNAAITTRRDVPPEDQSLDDIFEEFKKGVEQQAVKEDTDTHYNLGVAYKEMGLLEDAIAEFIMTHEGEPWYIQSRYMLGLCYMEMGEYQNAVAEIFTALNYGMSRGMAAQERIAMQYDLGLAYQGFGNIKEAMSEFQQVADVDPSYRDTAAKLKELRKGDFISLEQLKDDIEKEISAKFLEEGERIERKEKSRKSDKIRS